MTLLMFVVTALLGVVVGILSGMFGIGGGTVMIPLLHLLLRQPILTSTATSLFVIAPTAASGTFRHIRQGSVDVRAAVVIGLAGALACTVGSLVSDMLPGIAVAGLAACVILYSAVSIVRRPVDGPLGEEGAAPPSRFAAGRLRLLLCAALGLVAGLVAGIVGVGGGFVIVPVGIAYLGFSFKEASGTSLLAIALIAVPGTVAHALLGHVWYLGGLALMIGSIPGAYLGARLVDRMPERAARLAFAGLLALSACLVVFNELSGS
ncbi:MAG: sulfite exporter TauE/SafE family protein [Coriobacteriales bacterium]|jgi:uncharacterized membrane protein YfcA|nr:sulfite exporter TauE/SafE family protein [Coriobacteriales bacterium]